MEFYAYGERSKPTLLLLPGLGVSHEIFLPLVGLLKERFCIVAAEHDGFVLGRNTRFTSIDDQATQVIQYVQEHFGGRIDAAYGLSMGGKTLSRILERNEVVICHAILDAAPLLPLPCWLREPLRYYQAFNVWTCFRFTRFWRWILRSHYFDVLLSECKKIYPFGRSRAVLDGYKDVYANKLNLIECPDIHFWYGSKESFVAKPQVKHLQCLHSKLKVQVFKNMNHGQLLVDHPEDVAQRIIMITQ